jgi:hypothetical protein
VPVTRIAAAADRRALSSSVFEGGWREVRIVEKAEASEHVNFVADVPVGLGIESVAVEREAAGGVIIVLYPGRFGSGQRALIFCAITPLGVFSKLCGMMFRQPGFVAVLQRGSPGAAIGTRCEGSASVVPEASV